MCAHTHISHSCIIHINTLRYVFVCVITSTHAHTHTHIYIYIFTHTHTYIYIHTYIHTYIHRHIDLNKIYICIQRNIWDWCRFGALPLVPGENHRFVESPEAQKDEELQKAICQRIQEPLRDVGIRDSGERDWDWLVKIKNPRILE